MDDKDIFAPTSQRPTCARPLLGQTVLVVEDSRYACEALRLMCLRSGARLRRADCLKSAYRHLTLYRPTVMVVDVGLPDGSGADLIADAAHDVPRIPVILAISGDSGSESVALAAGADGFLAKPVTSLAVLQTAILSKLPPERRPIGPFALHDETVRPDPVAYRDDMAHVADILRAPTDGRVLDYVAQFLAGVARSAGDHTLEKAAGDLARRRAEGFSVGRDRTRIAGMVEDRLQQVPVL